MAQINYIHGYSQQEQNRLLYQNSILQNYIYENVSFENHQRILEIGCGVGAQMIYLLKKYPKAHLTGIDVSQKQLNNAKINLKNASIPSSRYKLYLPEEFLQTQKKEFKSFDSCLIVWVLEHVKNPDKLLSQYKAILNEKCKFFITEVFHQVLQIHPVKIHVCKIWKLTQKHQLSMNGNANIGFLLANILKKAKFRNIEVKPSLLYFDITMLDKKKEFLNYWKSLILSATTALLDGGLITANDIKECEKEMNELINNDESIFYYSFIQAKCIV